MKKNNIAFTFATAEVNFIGQLFIMITELLTGKLKLKHYTMNIYLKIDHRNIFGMMQLKTSTLL